MAKETGYRDSKSLQQVKAMMQNAYKAVYEYDTIGNISVAYEAPLQAEINDPCLRTKYKYDSVSFQIIAQEEEIVAWPGYEQIQVGAGNDIDNIADL